MKGLDAAKATSPQTAVLPAVIMDLLRHRGLSDPSELAQFLQPDYARDLADPYLMTGMEAAVRRIQQAIASSENVVVYGDYDVDGVVSTALLLEVLQLHGLVATSYIPDRFQDGYGLNIGAMAALRDQGASLIITVDCGITAVAEAQWARDNQLDVIITDHHEMPPPPLGSPDPVLPIAVAVVNPKQPGDTYPFKDLAGVGVTFALARALQRLTGLPAAGQEKWLLDLVALGTVCDVTPLVGENRCMVKYGLRVLRKTRRVGLVALSQAAGLHLPEAKAYHLGFILGPRLNAAGRIGHARDSLELLTTVDPLRAQELAYQLEELNQQRQLDQRRIIEEADAAAEQYSADPVLVLGDSSWSHGVVGIVAGKLAEKWQKPVLVMQVMEELAKGSGRSANGYSLIDGLRRNQHLLTKVGGHHHAAGFTLPTAQIASLRQALAADYMSVRDSLPPKALQEAELFLDNLAVLGWDIYNSLSELEPFGHGNPQPTFGVRGLKVIDISPVGKGRDHLKLRLADEVGTIMEAIAFNAAQKHADVKIGQQIDAIFFLDKNSYGDRTNLQLVIVGIG